MSCLSKLDLRTARPVGVLSLGQTIGNLVAGGIEQGQTSQGGSENPLQALFGGIEHIGSEIIGGVEKVGSAIINGVEQVGSAIVNGVETVGADVVNGVENFLDGGPSASSSVEAVKLPGADVQIPTTPAHIENPLYPGLYRNGKVLMGTVLIENNTNISDEAVVRALQGVNQNYSNGYRRSLRRC